MTPKTKFYRIYYCKCIVFEKKNSNAEEPILGIAEQQRKAKFVIIHSTLIYSCDNLIPR